IEIAHLGLKIPSRHKTSVGYRNRISATLARNRISPNMAHSMDAAHLVRVALACVRADITEFLMIHDSYACLAPDAPKFRKIILQELERLYRTYDPLKVLHDAAGKEIMGNPMAKALFEKKKQAAGYPR